jgi:hypothetical protein
MGLHSKIVGLTFYHSLLMRLRIGFSFEDPNIGKKIARDLFFGFGLNF